MMKFVILCCAVVAAAARAPMYFAPAAPLGYTALLQQPLYNYRGPLSLAPGQPANILAADGRPLDTLDVNLDRAAHFVAKALDSGSRVLKKRSVTRLAVAVTTNPVGVTAPLIPGAYVTGPFAAGPFGLSAPISTGPLAVSAGSFAVSTPVAAGSVVSTPAVAGTFGLSAAGTPFF